MGNPVFKHMRHKGGGPHNSKDKEARGYVTEKIKKELDEIDKLWIEDELIEHNNSKPTKD